MRLRNIRGSKETIAASDYVVQEPETHKGTWGQLFGNEQPVQIEVGMGKGRFIMDMARLHPDRNFVGIEMYDSVLLRAVQKREQLEEDLPNLYFIRMDARNLPDVFEKGEVDKIYLNFSDPWPKERHAKRRLTSRQFLERYDKILAPEGTVEFKTDNRLDRRTWYNLYERNTIEKFTELYWKENGIGGWEQHKIIPDRLYIGNAFCHLLLPGEEQ